MTFGKQHTRGISLCKGLGAGLCLVYWRNIRCPRVWRRLREGRREEGGEGSKGTRDRSFRALWSVGREDFDFKHREVGALDGCGQKRGGTWLRCS